MPTSSTLELNEAIESVEAHCTIDPTFFMSLARQLQLAVSASSNDLPELASLLGRLLKATLAKIPPAVMGDLDGESLAIANTAIFNAGQLSFAHQVISDALSQIGDETLISIVNDQRYRSYLLELARVPLSGIQLAQKCKQRPETVSRNIGELRELGLVEYRRQGTAFVNFLTPIGRALLQLPSHNAISAPISTVASSGYNALLDATRPAYRAFPIFGGDVYQAA